MAARIKQFLLLAVLLSVFILIPGAEAEASYTNEAGHRVDAVTEEGLELYYYNTKDDCDTVIVGYVGENPKVVIPDKIGNHRVLTIDDSAFEGNTLITEVELPDALKTIEKMPLRIV